MREQIQARVNELKRQLETGQIELQQLQARENFLRETMLRISGAMQVLEELLTKRQPIEPNMADPHNAEPVANEANDADVSRSEAKQSA